MSEPPPRPLEIRASRPSNDQTSNMPCRPLLGSQKFCFRPHGLRGNEPGGKGLPRSSTQTCRPASVSRAAVTEPPKPEPTTIASKCSCTTDGGTPALILLV